MSVPRNTVFWVLMLVILGGVFYFFDERAEDIKRADEVALRMFSFTPEDIVEVSIKKSGEKTLRFERQEEEWQLKEPIDVKGDKKVIEEMLKNVVGARRDGILFENPEPEKLKELGLDKFNHGIVLKTASVTIEINFGDKGPTNNVAYAMLKDDPKVYRLHSDIASEASKTLFDLRDKSIVNFEPLKAIRVEINRPSGKIVFAQPKAGKWDMIEPEVAPASMEKMLETLFRAKETKAKAFIDGENQDLASLGLDKAKLKLSVTEKIEDKTTEYILEFGNRDKVRRGYFAKTNRLKGVFVVEEGLVNHLLQEEGNWKE